MSSTPARFLGAAILALLLGCGLARAGEAGPAETPPAPDSLLAFVQAHPDCPEITDGCMICRIADGKPQCSVPSIACVRTALACIYKAR